MTAEQCLESYLRESSKISVFGFCKFAVSWGEKQIVSAETKEDGEEAAKRLCAQGDICGVAEMNLVPLKLPISEEKKEEPANTLMRNQVREHLMRFPTMGLNAVFFKAAGEKGEVLPLDDILPDPVKDQLEQTKNELSGLQLTGMYFAQCMRKQQKDPNQLRIFSRFWISFTLENAMMLK